jgi:hypothetical protein
LIIFEDKVGLTGTYALVVTRLDKEPLVGSIEYTPVQASGYTSGSVIPTITLNKTGSLVRSGETYTGMIIELPAIYINTGREIEVSDLYSCWT